jgi:hypothetical protein
VSCLNLFNRTITVSVQTKDEKQVIVDGIFIDSHHELVLSMTVDIVKFKIVDANGALRRAPHEDCLDTSKLLPRLVGIDLNRNVRKQIMAAVGGEHGCTHFDELALECVKGLKQAKFRLMKVSMPKEEVNAQLYDYLKGTCYHFRRKNEEESQVAR